MPLVCRARRQQVVHACSGRRHRRRYPGVVGPAVSQGQQSKAQGARYRAACTDEGKALTAISPAASQRLLPALDWLRRYDVSNLRPDLVAGFTLSAYLLPAGLGDASLANLPVEAGLYACLFSGLVFWLFCSSRHTVITVTSAISLLVGASLGGLAGGDVTRFSALAACTALMVSAMALIAYLLRAGVLTDFVSETVLVGFKSGVGLYLASTQLPKLFGFAGSHGDFWGRSHYFIANLDKTHGTALLLGLGAVSYTHLTLPT